MNISLEYLSSVLRYDPSTGEMFWLLRPREHFKSDWLHRRWNSSRAATRAGSFDAEGYQQIKIDGTVYRSHRLALYLAYGVPPAGEVDHINGVRSDNRLENLRVVSCQQNSRNRKMPACNKSGVVGVCWVSSRGKWMAHIGSGKRQQNLGYFDKFEDALQQRKSAELSFGYHVNHGRAA